MNCAAPTAEATKVGGAVTKVVAAASSEGAAAIAVAPTYATTGRETDAGVVADAMILDAIFGTGPVDSAKGVVV